MGKALDQLKGFSAFFMDDAAKIDKGYKIVYKIGYNFFCRNFDFA